MVLTIDVLRIGQSLVFIFGSIVVYYALRSYMRKKSQAMLFLGIGFAIITIGAIAAGILFELMGTDLVTVESVQTICRAIGFALVVYSLTGTKN